MEGGDVVANKNNRKRDRTSREEEDHGSESKRHKAEGEQDQPRVRLTDLPVELLYSIHLYAKNPSFTYVSRHFQAIFSSCPSSIKAAYLLARWYEAYCYGFHPVRKEKASSSSPFPSASSLKRKLSTPSGSKSVNNIDNKRNLLPATPKEDLLEGGSLPELIWSSRLLPVLPTSEFPHPLSNSFQRSADHFVLDYCLRYPICNSDVLGIVEDIVLSRHEFGNLILASGLWANERGQLCTYADFYGDGQERPYVKPQHLIVNHLPRRIFQKLDRSQSEETEESKVGVITQSSSLSTTHQDLDGELSRNLQVFGSGALPNPASLLLLLKIISLHVPTSPSFIAATVPVNSYEGFPLAKSAFARSKVMVQLLLSLGAEPTRKEGLALYVAIRSGWLDGLKSMIERDEVQITQWEAAIKRIRAWFQEKEARRRGGMRAHLAAEKGEKMGNSPSSRTNAVPQDQDHNTAAPKKKRRLLDRAQPDSKMLKEAVKHNQWAVANYIRSKGVIPDLRTIKLIEMKQPASSQAGSGSR